MRLREELKSIGGGVSEMFSLPLDKCVPNPDNIRINTPELQAHIRALANDMKVRGYDRNQPLEFRRLGENQYMIQNGNCRLAAALLANSEGAEIRTVTGLPEPDGLTEAARLARNVLANSGKRHTSEEYSLIIAKYRSWGWVDADIAATLQISLTTLLNARLLASAPEDVKQAVADNIISSSEATALVRSEGKGSSAVLAKAVEVAAEMGKSRVTASVIRETQTPGTGVRKKSAKKTNSPKADPPGEILIDREPATQPQPAAKTPEERILDTVKNATTTQIIAIRERNNDLTVASRAVIDAYETVGGDAFLEALDRLKEIIGWVPVQMAAE